MRAFSLRRWCHTVTDEVKVLSTVSGGNIMEIKSLATELNTNTYPGRGIVIGRTKDDKNVAIAYFIMGRSVNSRNRIFEENERGGIRTKAFDESKMEDPHLIIYNPVLKLDGKTIVTNGDQTDTIYDFMKEGKCYRHALLTREYEDDAPNYTPRISAVVKPNGDYNIPGAAGLLALFAWTIFATISLAQRIEQPFAKLVLTGVVTMWSFQILQEVGMCMGIMPITGIPLPFISFGLTSMVTHCLAIGVVQSVWLHRSKPA